MFGERDQPGHLFQNEYTRILQSTLFSGNVFLQDVSISAALGYALSSNFSGIDPLLWRNRSLTMGDLSLSIALLKVKKHAIKVGGGISIRHRVETLPASFEFDGTGKLVEIIWQNKEGNDSGFNYQAMYEFTMSSRLFVSGRMAIYEYPKTGSTELSAFGVYVGYKF